MIRARPRLRVSVVTQHLLAGSRTAPHYPRRRRSQSPQALRDGSPAGIRAGAGFLDRRGRLPMQRWNDAESFLLAEAAADLTDSDDVSPCLVAFSGDELLLVAFLRSFAKGEYADPLIELLALTAPLGADRLALS